MKYVEIKEPITILDKYTGEAAKTPEGKPETWSFLRFVLDFLLPDPAAGSGYSAYVAAEEIEQKVREAVNSKQRYVELTEAQWTVLKDVIEHPQARMRGPIGPSQLLPFMRAIVNATEEKPA